MTRDQQLKAFNNTKASKEQLREALAASLGVECERKSQEKEKTLFVQCRDTFLEAYKNHSGLDYYFATKDGVALSNIIKKIGFLSGTSKDDTLMTFKALINNLPDWYKQNAFSLTVINNKFNEIVASIRNNGRQQGITDSFKSRVLNDLAT